jgi:DNA-binding FrmR family transcriptional regulator
MAAGHEAAVAPSRDGHKEHGPQGVNQKALRRLKNIEGQVRGIQKMVEDQKYCVDILTQISAVRAALKSVGMVVLRRHVETCVADAIETGGTNRSEIIDELMGVLSKEEL